MDFKTSLFPDLEENNSSPVTLVKSLAKAKLDEISAKRKCTNVFVLGGKTDEIMNFFEFGTRFRAKMLTLMAKEDDVGLAVEEVKNRTQRIGFDVTVSELNPNQGDFLSF